MAGFLQGLIVLFLAGDFSHKEALEKVKDCAVCHRAMAAATVVQARHDGHAVKFSHALHLKLVKECRACHKGMEQAVKVEKANFPSMTDCQVCHTKIDPPFSCAQCHDEGFPLKPATHNNEYLEAHSRTGFLKEKQSCAVCHGKKFQCLGCHG